MQCLTSSNPSPPRLRTRRQKCLWLPARRTLRSMNNLPQGSANASGSRARPRIGITMGDPAGIGPEVVLKAVAEEEVREVCQPIIIGDAQLLAHHARTLDLQCGYEIVRRDERLPDQ